MDRRSFAKCLIGGAATAGVGIALAKESQSTPCIDDGKRVKWACLLENKLEVCREDINAEIPQIFVRAAYFTDKSQWGSMSTCSAPSGDGWSMISTIMTSNVKEAVYDISLKDGRLIVEYVQPENRR